jgi:hypothetical protein
MIENIQSSGFMIDWVESSYIKGTPKFASYISVGVAAKNTISPN